MDGGAHVTTHTGPVIPAPSLLPTIDLSESESTLVEALDSAFCEVGFCICNHAGLDPAIRDAAFAASRAFHALPDSVKAAYAINSAHRGYIAPKASTTRTSSVAEVRRPNTSESFILMHEVPESDPRFGQPLQGPNQWPQDVAEFREALEAYWRDVERVARQLTKLCLKALGIEAGLYEAWFGQPTEFLRLLHYWPEAPDEPEDSFGSAPHTDHGFLTLLVQDRVGGLQVKTPKGDWVEVVATPDQVVLNAADWLAHLSGGRWRSSPHRVKNRSGRDRYSIAYFFDPCMEAEAAPVTGEPLVYGDYILSRFNTNYRYRH